jgi:hypothetical protein
MTVYAVFEPFNPPPDCTSIDRFLSDWDQRQHDEAGRAYVYAFRDAAGSVFYIGKGQGNRAHDTDRHRHGRLGYYVAEFLGGTYTVDILRNRLSFDDAEVLEAQLIEIFGGQLVNWNGNLGNVLTSDVITQMRDVRSMMQALRVSARAEAAADRLETAVSICREALACLSEWERTEHETEVRELERLADTSLAARVDLHKLSEYVPHAPVLACEALSDLTRYLCTLGLAEDARREVEVFTERYPRGSFRDCESYDDRYARSFRTVVTKREQATLRRIQRGLDKLTDQHCAQMRPSLRPEPAP